MYIWKPVTLKPFIGFLSTDVKLDEKTYFVKTDRIALDSQANYRKSSSQNPSSKPKVRDHICYQSSHGL